MGITLKVLKRKATQHANKQHICVGIYWENGFVASSFKLLMI